MKILETIPHFLGGQKKIMEKDGLDTEKTNYRCNEKRI